MADTMKDGFIKVAAATPELAVADCTFNTEQIILLMKKAQEQGSAIIVFPELCVTGYCCSDLFSQDRLLEAAESSLIKIIKASKGISALVFIGLPVQVCGKLFNCAAAVQNGKLLGLVPKSYLPNYSEFYEVRHFEPADRNSECTYIFLCRIYSFLWDRSAFLS